MADEAGFLELLVANERLLRCLDTLKDPNKKSRHKHAVASLHQDLQKGKAYVEEATRMGVVPVLQQLLSQPNDLTACDDAMAQVSQILQACSRLAACGGRVCLFRWGGVPVAIREGALGDGLGAQVWCAAHILCRELEAHPEIFTGQRVLELGSGTGLVGLLAARAGAEQVCLTDYEPQVLLNLRTCMHMNTAVAAAAAAAAHEKQQGNEAHDGSLDDLFGGGDGDGGDDGGSSGSQQHVPDDAELFDDAESVEDLDLAGLALQDQQDQQQQQQAGDHSAALAAAASQATAWDADNIRVCRLDWRESERALAASGEGPCACQQDRTASSSSSSQEGCSDGSSAPGVALGLQFPVILASDVMYEPGHAALVAAAIKHRLQPGGRALLCFPVREAGVLEQFLASCEALELRCRQLRVQPMGVPAREREYEGGYLLVAVDHAAAPAADWHRADFE